MEEQTIQNKLFNLYEAEEHLRKRAIKIIEGSKQLQLHLTVVEYAMDLADVFRQFKTNDEDIKTIQILGMRMFNAFGASIKLTCSGYHQNGALILRDVLETVFLIDLFTRDKTAITLWRLSDQKERLKRFRPVKVREALDKEDGF